MKLRIFKKEDGSVAYSSPSEKYQGGHFVDVLTRPIYEEEVLVGYEQKELTFADCKFGAANEGLPYIDIEADDAPKSDSTTENYHEQIFFDGECAVENLKQDTNWEKMLMPTFLVKKKEILFQKAALATLLEGETPDAIECIRTNQKIETVRALASDLDIYKLAKENLVRAEIDKTAIGQKLDEKIAELEAAEGGGGVK